MSLCGRTPGAAPRYEFDTIQFNSIQKGPSQADAVSRSQSGQQRGAHVFDTSVYPLRRRLLWQFYVHHHRQVVRDIGLDRLMREHTQRRRDEDVVQARLSPACARRAPATPARRLRRHHAAARAGARLAARPCSGAAPTAHPRSAVAVRRQSNRLSFAGRSLCA